MRSVVILTVLLGIYGLVFTPARFHLEQRHQTVRKVGALASYSGLNIVSCSKDVCIEIKSSDAVHGLLGNVSIKNASVIIQNQKTKTHIAKFDSSAFYDIKGGSIFFTEIRNSKFKEAYFDQREGKFLTM